ncbi:MAG TPA: VWA domain-containing protein [Chloroflexota bacterium]|nr:VWA domain-containing protein [Chloroflexota bacterium]
MNLLAPIGLALAITLPIIVIFYLLKVRRHDEEISSTFLWNDLIRDLAAHEPLQRLKWSLLLLLQLIGLALIAFAVARPFTEQEGQKPVHAVLLLDGSASMHANDVQPSRFDKAVQAAQDTLKGLPENSLATAVLVAAHPQVLVAATTDRRQVEKALANAQPSGAAADMREALLLARSLGGDPSARRIYLFTDSAFTLPADLPDDLGSVDVVSVAEPKTGNLAITAISTRPDPRDNRRQQLFTRVENFSSVPAQAVATIAVDGQPIDERSIDVPPNGQSEQVFEDLQPGARWASVSVADRRGDNGLTLDDTAYAILVQRKPAQVLLVSPGNAFLEKVLSLLPNVDLFRTPAQRYLAVEADRFDVIVFDDYLPPLLPRGNLLVVNPPDRGPFRSSGEVRRPRVGNWEREDPLLSFVDMRDLNVNRASKLDLPRWMKPLISTADGVPLFAAGQDGDRRVAILPFDLRQSNLPNLSAFPILMSNLLTYLSPPGVVRSPEIHTGAPESLAPFPQVERVRVSAPDDQAVEFRTSSGPITYAATDTPGLYRVQQIVAGGGQTVEDDLFAANLADRDESDIRPRLSGLAGKGAAEIGLTLLQREFWGILAALALPLLLFEWFWFHRRV